MAAGCRQKMPRTCAPSHEAYGTLYSWIQGLGSRVYILRFMLEENVTVPRNNALSHPLPDSLPDSLIFIFGKVYSPFSFAARGGYVMISLSLSLSLSTCCDRGSLSCGDKRTGGVFSNMRNSKGALYIFVG